MPLRRPTSPAVPRATQRTCYVYLQMPGSLEVVTCGLFAQRETAAGTIGVFRYGRKYLARRDAVPLDEYELPLQSTESTTTRRDGMFGALRDASPDAWGRLVIQSAMGRADLTEMDYLLQAPEDRAGALTFGHGETPPPPIRSFNRVLRLRDLLDAAAIIEQGADAPEGDRMAQARLLLEQPGSTMGGARAKNVVEDAGALWIAKFPARGDTWNSAAAEAGLLALASACDIRTPETRVVTVDQRAVLLVRRFDRDAVTAGDPGYLRHRMLSGLTILGAEEGVVDRQRWSYLRLADELQRRSARPAEDRHELYRRMVFNALVSNTDDHPRNHAIIAPTTTWHLAPAFDITPTPMTGRRDRLLAMTAGPDGRAARRYNLMAGAPQFGVSPEEAGAVIDRMVDVVRTGWEGAMRRAGATTADIAAVAPAILDEGFEYDRP